MAAGAGAHRVPTAYAPLQRLHQAAPIPWMREVELPPLLWNSTNFSFSLAWSFCYLHAGTAVAPSSPTSPSLPAWSALPPYTLFAFLPRNRDLQQEDLEAEIKEMRRRESATAPAVPVVSTTAFASANCCYWRTLCLEGALRSWNLSHRKGFKCYDFYDPDRFQII